MGLLGKIFGANRAVSPLEQRLNRLSFEEISGVLESAPYSELRLPGAISLTILMASHGFVMNVRNCMGKLKMGGDVIDAKALYDVIVYETAAYAHYWLLHEALQAWVDDVEVMDDVADELSLELQEDPETQNFMRAITFSWVFLKKHGGFLLPEHHLAHRALNYCRASDRRFDLETSMGRFEHALHCSVVAGRPSEPGRRALGFLDLDLALKASIPIFHSTTLVGLSETVERMLEVAKR